MNEKTAATDLATDEIIHEIVKGMTSAGDGTTEQLLDAYREEAAMLRVTLEIVRQQIEDLFTDGVMPTPAVVVRRLYPISVRRLREETDRYLQDPVSWVLPPLRGEA